jgi:hypothetical protein
MGRLDFTRIWDQRCQTGSSLLLLLPPAGLLAALLLRLRCAAAPPWRQFPPWPRGSAAEAPAARRTSSLFPSDLIVAADAPAPRRASAWCVSILNWTAEFNTVRKSTEYAFTVMIAQARHLASPQLKRRPPSSYQLKKRSRSSHSARHRRQPAALSSAGRSCPAICWRPGEHKLKKLRCSLPLELATVVPWSFSLKKNNVQCHPMRPTFT